ncbi:MAG: hypothetical protein ACLFVC_08450, partial [Opitutales bacterium]
WFPSGNWVLAKRHGSEVSAEFYDRSLPALRMQLILYPEGGGLADFEEASLATYLEAVADSHPDSEVEVLNSGEMRPPEGSIPFLGGYYRQIFYRVSPLREGEGAPAEFADALAFTDSGALVVLRVTGPAHAMEYIRQNFGGELGSFTER